MKKLTIEHLAPYLPYSLKIKDDGGEINTLSADGRESIFHIGILDVIIWANNLELYPMPILRPLNDINNNNHLLNLAKIDGSGYLDDCEPEYFRFGIKCGIYKLSFNLDGFNVDINRTAARVTNQLKLWQYIYQNHFDVFNLIERGLAIDINTIK